MALAGKRVAQIDTKCNGDAFHRLLRYNPYDLCNVAPADIQGCELLEGEGAVGSILKCNWLIGIKELRAIPSTIHAMMKFPTPGGVATLVTRSIIISECRKLEEKFLLRKETEAEVPPAAVIISEDEKTEEIVVHPAYPDQVRRPSALRHKLPKLQSPKRVIQPSAIRHKFPNYKTPRGSYGQVPFGTSCPNYKALRRFHTT
ncbi:kirola [Artemisia annua]|uniref:Kirola n=1 Tax=Artemisia annua TaxID=35608 RepID=A0A2U1P768_ARTAN|nr:kirola [Artemisia annua]